MGSSRQNRRAVLKGAIAAAVGSAASTVAAAADRDPITALLNVLGILKAPARQPVAARTSAAGDALSITAAIALLENEVASLGLSPTRLSLEAASSPSAPLPTTAEDLYAAGVPRLVSIIDRTESTNVEIGDRAGSLLADVNLTEHVIPEALDPHSPPSKARDYPTLKDEYAALFASAVLRPERSDLARWHLTALREFRRRYEAASRVTGVPWFFIGVIHGLEASYNFRAHLHNGDFPLSQRTRQVPAGRPKSWTPPYDWEASAVDALKLMGFAGATDWSLERTLYRLEAYNGFGYRRLGVPTPYLWSFSNHYEAGKFVADGSFNAKARSQQCGAATTLKLLTEAGEVMWA